MAEVAKSSGPHQLLTGEIFWRDHQKWLEECGYMLRPRYMPDWQPAWAGTKQPSYKFEDSLWLMRTQHIDAIRLSDGSAVGLKKVSKSQHPFEIEIGEFFSSDPIDKDPQNHCVPLLQTLAVPDDPDLIIIVMPLLREYDSPRFDTYGEAIDCIKQLFEGLYFMHRHHVAHRDCNRSNFMVDATCLFPDGYHPQETDMKRDYKGTARYYTRTQRPPKYYLIDFGISRKYDPTAGPPLEAPIFGGDKSVPEFHRSLEPCDPFPTDVYYAGNLIREDFLDGDGLIKGGKVGFEFLRPLVQDMVQDDPAKRPTMEEVVARFEILRKGLSSWKLRSRVVKQRDFPFALRRTLAHWTRRVSFIMKRTPPIPHPK